MALTEVSIARITKRKPMSLLSRSLAVRTDTEMPIARVTRAAAKDVNIVKRTDDSAIVSSSESKIP